VDVNQPAIVAALRADRWTVMLLSRFGASVDLLCADGVVPWPAGTVDGVIKLLLGGSEWRAPPIGHRVWICEVKDGAKPPSARRLKRHCAEVMLRWPGPGAVALTPEEAVEAGRLCRKGWLESAAMAARRYISATGGIDEVRKRRTA
jgi:hypothetical protein